MKDPHAPPPERDATPIGQGGGPDPFERGQREAEALRDAMAHLREDVRAIVRDEVSRAGMSGAELERMVRDAVAREARASRPAAAPAWGAPALAAAGVLIGLLAGVLGYRALAGGDAPGDAAAGTVAERTLGAGDAAGPAGPAAAGPSGAATEPTGPASAPTPTELAAVYDSLLAAGSDRLAPMIGRLESAGPAAPVAEAIGAWRAGGPLTPAQRRRLHDGLVQLALNEEADAGLVLDGLVSRGPCRGSSCGALLDLWRSRGGELGLPALPDDPASDAATLAVVERVLVLRRAEGAGAGEGTG